MIFTSASHDIYKCIPWYLQGHPMIFSSIFHDIYKYIPWYFQVYFMIFTSTSHDIFKYISWYLQVHPVIFTRTSHDIFKYISWYLHRCVVFCFVVVVLLLLTHWGRVMHICVGNLTIIGSDNGLLPGRRQAIIWTNAGILLIGPLGTNFSEFLFEIKPFHSRKSIWKCRLRNCGHLSQPQWVNEFQVCIYPYSSG